MLKLKFSEPSEPKVFYHYLPAKKDDFGDQPHIVDEVAEEYIEVRHINDHEVRMLAYFKVYQFMLIKFIEAQFHSYTVSKLYMYIIWYLTLK